MHKQFALLKSCALALSLTFSGNSAAAADDHHAEITTIIDGHKNPPYTIKLKNELHCVDTALQIARQEDTEVILACHKENESGRTYLKDTISCENNGRSITGKNIVRCESTIFGLHVFDMDL